MTHEQEITVDGLRRNYRDVKVFDDWIVLGLVDPGRFYLYHACKDLASSIMSVNLAPTCAHCGIDAPKGVRLFMQLMKVNP
jgi:hypothetical protein